ncbi:trypsin-like serine protease [Streptococcus cameli]
MKHRKSLSSVLLLSVLLGTTLPVATLAESTSSTSSSVAVSSSSSSSVEPSSTSSVEPSSSSSDEPSSSSSVEPSSSSSVEPSSSSSVEPSSSSSVEPSSSSSDEPSSSSSTEPSEKTAPDLSSENATLEAIIGKDDQYRVKNTKAFPYRTVVHLEMEYDDGTYVGSGVMIAPNLILTVAHNVYNQRTKKWAKSVTAAPARNGGETPYGKFEAANYYVLRTYTTEGNVVPSNYDIAVIKLTKNVPSSVGYLPISKTVSRNERLQVPGYPAYTSSKARYMHTSFGKADGISSKQISHTVDTEGGNSGSPILNAKNQVVGVHSAGRYGLVRPYGDKNWGRRIDGLALQMIDIAKKNKATNVNVTAYRETKSGTTYRLYNPNLRRHLYTQSLNEANALQKHGWRFEGVSFRTVTSGKPVYRLYNRALSKHFYTTSQGERDILVAKHGWRYEGVAWYSGGTKPVYRLYHPIFQTHLYTANKNEKDILAAKHGWRYEGVAFYTK